MNPKIEFPDEFEPLEPEKERERFQPPRSRRWLILVLLAALLFIWPLWAGFYTDWLWFQQLGFQKVFTTTLLTKLFLGSVVGLLTAAIIWINFRLAIRQSSEVKMKQRQFVIEGQQISTPDLSVLVKRLAAPASILIGAFAGMIAWGSWETFLRFRHQVPFGETDPIFGRDVAFYFFTLPALEAVSRWLLFALGACLAGSLLIYMLRGAADFIESRMRFKLTRGARMHLLGLLAAVFLVFALQSYLSMPGLLFGNSGPVAGATYSDINASLPILYVEMAVAVIVALLALVSIFLSSSRILWTGLVVYALVMLAGWIYPAIVQRFSVAPNELAKETPYIMHNIAATRKAFGLDKIEERQLTGEKTLTAENIKENQRTINNIRLWDQQQLLDTFAQIQEIRTYYEFHAVDNDRYQINGELQQVMLSPRELSPASLPNRNWINERFIFTHGFGLTLGPVNKATAEGLPVLFVQDIPPISNLPSLKIDRPEIYFGEMSDERVYVRTREEEFNYPSGEQNVSRNYDGDGGIPIGSRVRQILFATRFSDLKLVLSNALTPESRVLFYRNIRERLERVAPYLEFDSDPYMVVNDGRLFWIVDAYTFSNRYPYSQTVGSINYIRNSVKAVVDAYHGHVNLYIADKSDPVIQTYERIYPGTLKPLSEMPEGLRAHMRYPEDIFKIQTQIYSTYHMDQPQIFYNKEDLWTAALMGDRDGKPAIMDPYYTIMKLPGEKKEEFILMLPFTPKNKDNLAAWMAARSDGEHYGKMVVYRFPKQKLVFGPKQVVARFNQDPEISRQLSLWNQRGSNVILGTLMVIPVEESLIYVQPLYLRAESGRIPELRRVIVAAENQIAMEPTLEASLGRIFESNLKPQTTDSSPQSPAAALTVAGDAISLAAQAKQHYERAMQAQREGDWARYGDEIKRLGAVLGQMSKQ